MTPDDIGHDDFYCYECRLQQAAQALDDETQTGHQQESKAIIAQLNEVALFRRAVHAVLTRDPLPNEKALRSILGA